MKSALRLELVLLTLAAALAAAAIPWFTGYFAWSWDALNHHIYLGMTAEHARWDLDVIPANYQSYQYPYLYWPVYRLSLWDTSGAFAGAVWSAFQASLLLPPVWYLCHRLLPAEGAVFSLWLERSVGCLLAFTSLVVLTGLETTANDLLAAVPLLWALVLATRLPGTPASAALAAALLGAAAAFKLSNGLFLPLLLVWLWVPHGPVLPWRRALLLGAGYAAGFGLLYAPWGWQLWRVTGNPFYPYLAHYFGGP
ncbi:MAG: hypothetical protein WAQ05_10545 [Rubrivivax sp.]